MNFEQNKQESTINDFYLKLNEMLAKWTAEGNKDSEPSFALSIKQQVEIGEITPKEGIERLQAIDDGRIER